MDSSRELYQAKAEENSVSAVREGVFSGRIGLEIPAFLILFAMLGEARKNRQALARNPNIS
jgi:hypothetical protein